MHPRTLIIVIACILGSAIGIRTLIERLEWFNPSEEAFLKRACAISVSYRNGNMQKSCTITDPTEVQELLGLLHLSETHAKRRLQTYYSTSVQFVFANGMSRQYTLNSEEEWSGISVDRAFTERLREIVSRKIGEPVILFDKK